ncbi:MAG: DUF3450 domain-containing protein [Bdellovibrionota bacterium]
MRRFRYIFFSAALSLPTSSSMLAAGQEKLKKSINEEAKTSQEGASSQKKIDKIADQSAQMLDEYRGTLSRIETTKAYNEQIKNLLESQKEEMATIAKQIASIEDTHQAVVPLMIRMVDALDKFVSLDLPFLPLERKKRVEDLKSMLNRADVSTSEKYRRIMEAFQIENEYGRTIEAYRDSIQVDGNNLTVDFLRVGRILLAYQSIDGLKTGLWDQKSKAWKKLSDDYRKDIRDGLRIARKQAAPDLISLPIKAAEASR